METSFQTKTALTSDMDQKQPCTAALVMGTNYRALGLVRCLGRRGIPVWVLETDPHMLARFSRYTERSLPWPAGDDRTQIDYLLSIALTHQLEGALLFPTDDEGATLVARNHEELSQRFNLTTPPWDELQWACNKKLMYQMAQSLDLHQPLTFFPRDRAELLVLNCPFPAVVKPAMRIEANQLTVDKAWLVLDRESLLRRYDEACSLLSSDLIMIQEFLPGWGEAQFSYVALCDGGDPLASVTARRTRQVPMDFGRFSSFVETVEEPRVVEPAIRLLNALCYTGLVEVEFKRDPRDGEYKLLDINTRVWGWHTLCGRAGVDFPYLVWLMTQGEPVPELHAQTGVRWARLGADLYTAFREVVRGRLSVRTYLQSLRGPIEWAIFATDDPLPFLWQFPALPYLMAKRALKAKKSKASIKTS
jgi:D-aspartate ligase